MIQLFGSWDAYYSLVPGRIVEEQIIVWLAERQAKAKLYEGQRQIDGVTQSRIEPPSDSDSDSSEDEDEKLQALYKQLTGA